MAELKVKYDAVLEEVREADGDGGSVGPSASGAGRFVAVNPVYSTDDGYVAVLDSTHDTLIGENVFGATALTFRIVSSDPEVTGDIVLTLGEEDLTVAVGATEAWVTVELETPFTGALTLELDTGLTGASAIISAVKVVEA